MHTDASCSMCICYVPVCVGSPFKYVSQGMFASTFRTHGVSYNYTKVVVVVKVVIMGTDVASTVDATAHKGTRYFSRSRS